MSISITRRSRDEIIKSINNNDLVIDVGGVLPPVIGRTT